MKIATLKNKLALAVIGLVSSGVALAGNTSASDDAFGEFYTTVTEWTTGPLGMGLATTMLLMGGAIGVAKNSPMPALTGIAGAAFLKWGPDIIQGIMGGLV
jgi:conjugal transfer pilus assembly protein TraA